jgi:hypothetical protein
MGLLDAAMSGLISQYDARQAQSPDAVSQAYQQVLQKQQQDRAAREQEYQAGLLGAMPRPDGPVPAQQEQAYLKQALQEQPMPEQSPLERWKSQVDALITSGNPVLQQQGMDMLQAYHQRATEAATGGSTPAAIQEYLYAKNQGYQGTFQDWKQQNKAQMFPQQRVTRSDAAGLRFKPEHGGGKVDPGTPWSEIQGKVESFTSEERKETGKRGRATAIREELEGMLFGEDGLYQDYPEADSLEEKVKYGIEKNVQYFTQDDPRVKSYVEYAEGVLSPLVKSLGEAGALAEGDIERARSLIPRLTGYKVDSPTVAREKLRKLQALIDAGQEKGYITKSMVDDFVSSANKVEAADKPKPASNIDFGD